MKPLSEKWLRVRIAFLLCLFSLFFLIVVGRAYQLQVLQSQKLAVLAERQHQRVVPLVPKRGILYDRKREELAISMDVDSVFAQPGKMENLAEAAKKIAPVLGKKPEAVLKKLKEEKPFVWLERGVTAEQRAAIEKHNLEGVDFLKEAKRFYPQREVGAQVIGFAGLDSQGLEGIELGYDEFLKGEPGYILIAKDALGRPISPEDPGRAPIAGGLRGSSHPRPEHPVHRRKGAEKGRPGGFGQRRHGGGHESENGGDPGHGRAALV